MAREAEVYVVWPLYSVPSLLAVCNGDLATVDQYKGEMKGDALRAFLSNFAAGRRCSNMIKLDAQTDFSKLRVGQLKQLLKDRGVTCMECIEKADFVLRLRELVSSLKS